LIALVQDGLKLSDHFGDLAIEQPQNLGIQAFVAPV
jgi:hypothetical protein